MVSKIERILWVAIFVLMCFSSFFYYQYQELSEAYEAKTFELRSQIVEKADMLEKAEATIAVLKNQLRGTN